jgi:hypothetical protein
MSDLKVSPPLHLSNLVPNWQTALAASETVDIDNSVAAKPKQLAISHGKPLAEDAPTTLPDLYNIVWQPKEISAQQSPAGSWLIFADQNGMRQQLATLLQNQGERCVLIFASHNNYNKIEENRYTLNPAHPQNFQRLLEDSLAVHYPS